MAYPVFLFMVKYEQKIKIKSLAEDDRPREKLMRQGRKQLSNAEILAIIIGKGSTAETAVELSQRILSSYDNDWHKLDKASVKELCQFYGIGEAKAIAIIAAIELGRRRENSPKEPIKKINSSKDAFDLMNAAMSDLNHEEFWILILKNDNSVKSKHMISRGGFSGTVADPKVIFKLALEQSASYLVLMHNHPSGNLVPSAEDIKITKKLIEVGRIHDLLVLDHLIVGNGSYYSMADEGII